MNSKKVFEIIRKRFQVELEDEVCDLCSEQFEEICVDSEKGECHGGSHEMSSKWMKTCPETLVLPILICILSFSGITNLTIFGRDLVILKNC